MTHQDLARIATLLERVRNLTMESAKDPATIGQINAEALCCGFPIKFELERHQVKIVQEVA